MLREKVMNLANEYYSNKENWLLFTFGLFLKEREIDLFRLEDTDIYVGFGRVYAINTISGKWYEVEATESILRAINYHANKAR